MGKRYRTLITDPSLFFVTTTLKDWRPLFSCSEILDKVRNQLFALIPGYADVMLGYVLMPNHVHLMIGCKKGGKQLSEFMKAFKSITARSLFPNLGSVWMSRFDDLVITSEQQFLIKLNYIHQNPVRADLVDSVLDWEWSSARFWDLDEESQTLTKNWDWIPRHSR
jgi:putative transposase